ncbi:hypothetical protein MBLNU230_g1513t1 [Neophaeotheca triangularis]
MREERHDSNKSPAPATNVTQGQTASTDTAAGGFTAVNGEASRHASFRPEKVSEKIASTVEDASRPPTWTSYADTRHDMDDYSAFRVGRYRETSIDGGKRKRTDREEGADDSRAYTQLSNDDERPTKQRRAVPVDPAIEHYPSDRVLPDMQRGSAAAPSTAGGFSREMTPARRKNASQPPPRPHPETEARLAESLQRELGTVASPRPVEHNSPTHQSTPYDARQPQHYSPDQFNSGEASEGKKGKRDYRPRTKTGCHTCRRRKKKCDEGQPYCNNCFRGNFQCEGYGPKPPGGSKSNANRNNVPLQAKHPYEPSHGPIGHYPMPEHPQPHLPPPPPGTSYSHWGRVEQGPPPRYSEPHPEDSRHGGHRESYPPRPAWPVAHEHPAYAPEQYIPPDYNNTIPPLQSIVRDAVPDGWAHPTAAMTPYRGPPGPERMLSSHGSVSSDRTSHHQRAAQLALSFPSSGQMSEKDKMLLGKPYLHYLDTILCADREACKSALERYNDAARPSSGVSTEERARLSRAIVDPSTRFQARNPGANPLSLSTHNGHTPSNRHPPAPTPPQTDPIGRIGHRTLVETPFNCDYGYNLQIGDDSVIGANCHLQDAAPIIIGNRCVIGPNVKFYAMTTSIASSARRGSQGAFTAGAIVIEDDVVIGGDAIVLAYRTVGKGAFVGAGCVVSKDVKPNTVVVGNPMQLVRGIGGEDIERHREPVQSENEAMLAWMQGRRGVYGREGEGR